MTWDNVIRRHFIATRSPCNTMRSCSSSDANIRAALATTLQRLLRGAEFASVALHDSSTACPLETGVDPSQALVVCRRLRVSLQGCGQRRAKLF